MTTTDTRTTTIDPITYAVVHNGLLAAGRQVFTTLRRAGMHPLIYETQDFGIAVMDAEVNLLTQAGTAPTLAGPLDYAAEKMIERIGRDNIGPGDVLLTNLPEIHGIHQPDFVLLEPVFESGDVIAYIAVRVHAGDVGGAGLLPTAATEVFQEGLLLPPMKLREAGEVNELILDIVRSNSRIPETTVGNTMAAMGAIGVGADAIAALVARYGRESYLETVREALDHGERVARAAIGRIPDGVYEAGCALDDNGVAAGVPVELHLKVTIDGERMTVDTTGSAPEQQAPINCPFSLTQASLRSTLKLFGTGDIPANAGESRVIDVIAPPGSIFNPGPLAPSFWAGRMGQLLTIMMLPAIAKALPEELPAMHGPDIGSAHALLRHPGSGRWTFNLFVGGTGMGGRLGADGPTALYSAPAIRSVPLEVMETRDPAMRWRLEIDQDSGGPGRWRGGLGVVHEAEYLSTGLGFTAVYTSGGGTPIEGVAGGGRPKRPSGTIYYAGTDREIRPPDCRNSNLPIEPGDRVIAWTAGGGGYGDPFERDIEAVAWDVRNEYVSVEMAAEAYGVVVDAMGVVDADATAALRAARRERSQGGPARPATSAGRATLGGD